MQLINITYAVFELLWMFMVFLLVFYLLPRVYLSEHASNGDTPMFYEALIRGLFAAIVGMHVVVLLKLSDSFAVIFITTIVLTFINFFRNRKRGVEDVTILEKAFLSIADLFDSKLPIIERIQVFAFDFMKGLNKLWRTLIGTITRDLPLAVLNLITFGSALYMRAYHSVTHYTFPASDAYAQLVWIKQVDNNQLYLEGVKPYGMHVVFSYISTLFNIDPYNIIRFLGALVGMIIVLSIYSFVRFNFSGSKYAPWLASTIYVFAYVLPTSYWRQTTVLPLEFALMVFLPAIHFFKAYLESRNIQNLRLSMMAFVVIAMTHFQLGLITLGCLVLLAVLHIKVMRLEKLFKVVGVHLIAAEALSFLPMVLGLFFGHPWIGQSIENLDYTLELLTLIKSDWILLIALGLSLITSIVVLVRKSAHIKIVVYMTLLNVGFYILYRAESFQVNRIILDDEMGIVLSIFASMALGLVFSIFLNERMKKTGLGLSVLIIIGFIGYFGIKVPQSNQYEYEQSALGYNAIIKQIKSGTMTLIAPQEQYQQILGYGYHYQLWQLMKNQNGDRLKPLQIPTENVFIFVEKVPFGGVDTVSIEIAHQLLPDVTGDYTKYYSDYRDIVEAKAYYWSEAFMTLYPEAVSVFYEDDVFKIYWIKQDLSKLLNFNTGQPLEVFNP